MDFFPGNVAAEGNHVAGLVAGVVIGTLVVVAIVIAIVCLKRRDDSEQDKGKVVACIVILSVRCS